MTLSREQIMSMSAESELDALVAEYVFQKQVRWTQDEWSDPYPIDEHGTIVGQFSTEIMDAWEVVEKMHQEKYAMQIMHLEDGNYFVAFSGFIYNESIAETAPLAICKAALLTLIQEVQT